jgi:hypothetical protein
MHIIKNYREAALFARQLGLIEPLPPDEFT